MLSEKEQYLKAFQIGFKDALDGVLPQEIILLNNNNNISSGYREAYLKYAPLKHEAFLPNNRETEVRDFD